MKKLKKIIKYLFPKMEKHKCEFVKITYYNHKGRFWRVAKCKHEGCNIMLPLE